MTQLTTHFCRTSIAILVISMVFVPFVVFAQNNDFQGISSLLLSFLNVLDILVVIAFTLILLAFFWGLAKYVFQADNQEARDQGKRIMLGGIIALFVASSIWGIVELIQLELGIVPTGSQPVPQAPTN